MDIQTHIDDQVYLPAAEEIVGALRRIYRDIRFSEKITDTYARDPVRTEQNLLTAHSPRGIVRVRHTLPSSRGGLVCGSSWSWGAPTPNAHAPCAMEQACSAWVATLRERCAARGCFMYGIITQGGTLTGSCMDESGPEWTTFP